MSLILKLFSNNSGTTKLFEILYFLHLLTDFPQSSGRNQPGICAAAYALAGGLAAASRSQKAVPHVNQADARARIQNSGFPSVTLPARLELT
jgi:hypothetical protein